MLTPEAYSIAVERLAAADPVLSGVVERFATGVLDLARLEAAADDEVRSASSGTPFRLDTRILHV